MLALMSAENPRRISANGKYTFTMPQPVPAYLLALAVGRVEFRRIGERSGVYAEPEIAGKAVQEFVDVDSMLAVMERLWGPYRWGRYDILVLPPSFPFGGMENPRLTFVTPTIVTGDRSLVGLIAHELAHSWAGNLVTNETWNDVWLNEGMAVYLERRVTEQLWGRDRADMETDLELYDLRQTIDELGPAHPDTRLRIDLAGRAPQEVNTTVTYGKGYHFLRAIEEASGRSRMDEFLRTYFTRFAFQPMTTDRFLSFLRSNAIQGDSALGRRIRPEDWIDRPGLPTATPPVSASGFVVVDHEAKRWLEGTPARELQTGGWVAQQWIRFIRRLAPSLTAGTMVELDAAFGLSRRENAEILQEWLLCAVTHHYEPAFPALEDFLTTVGRTRYVLPLYSRMAQTPEGRARALAIYARARDGYHPLTAGRIDRLLRRERP
jgi:aminopeptidase N